MHPLISAAGHQLITPTYTGLGEREHLANIANDLETHILDILGVIKYEDLRDIVLIGHSYGGMVATGVGACRQIRRRPTPPRLMCNGLRRGVSGVGCQPFATNYGT